MLSVARWECRCGSQAAKIRCVHGLENRSGGLRYIEGVATVKEGVVVLALQVERIESTGTCLHRQAILRKVAMYSALMVHGEGHAVVLFHAQAREKALVWPGEE